MLETFHTKYFENLLVCVALFYSNFQLQCFDLSFICFKSLVERHSDDAANIYYLQVTQNEIMGILIEW